MHKMHFRQDASINSQCQFDDDSDLLVCFYKADLKIGTNDFVFFILYSKDAPLNVMVNCFEILLIFPFFKQGLGTYVVIY